MVKNVLFPQIFLRLISLLKEMKSHLLTTFNSSVFVCYLAGILKITYLTYLLVLGKTVISPHFPFTSLRPQRMRWDLSNYCHLRGINNWFYGCAIFRVKYDWFHSLHFNMNHNKAEWNNIKSCDFCFRHSRLDHIDLTQCSNCFTHFQIQRCVELVSRAKKPVILLGSQATLPPTTADDVRSFSHSFFFILVYGIIHQSPSGYWTYYLCGTSLDLNTTPSFNIWYWHMLIDTFTFL